MKKSVIGFLALGIFVLGLSGCKGKKAESGKEVVRVAVEGTWKPYNYVDENGLHGYKDIYGNVIIEPKLPRSSPFFNGVAYIRNIDGRFGHWFLDKNGKLFNFKTVDDVRNIEPSLELTERLKYIATAHYDTSLWNFPLSFPEQAYQIDIWGDIVGSLVGNSCYLIDNETPIMNLEIENPEKAKELNKKI